MAALHNAAAEGNINEVNRLITQKTDISATDANDLNNTPLHLAAEEGHLAVVEILIGKGAKINAKNNHGKTPLQLAVKESNWSIAGLLRSHGDEA